ncbi:MAG: hypothetical protein RID23_00595 [Roseovarius sp.]
MQRLPFAALALLLASGQPLLAQSTQQDVEAEESPQVDVPRSEVVEEGTAEPDVDDPSDVGVESNFESTGTEPVTDPELPTGADPSLEMVNDMRKLLDSIRSKTPRPKEPLSHLDSLEDVYVLPLSAVEHQESEDGPTLDEVLQANQEAVAEYRQQLGENELVLTKLEEAGFTPADVLTWETAGTEVATVVVDDR